MLRQKWPGIVLILLGIILLIHQLDIVDFSRADIFSYGFIILGILLLIKGAGNKERKGILGGAFFLSLGVFWSLMRNGILVQDDHFGFATLFFALAVANFVYFIVGKNKGANFIWGIVFALVGGIILLRYYHCYYYWDIYDEIIMYWPLILILIGVMLIIRGYKKPAKV